MVGTKHDPQDRQRALLMTGKFADVILGCGGRHFHLHKNVICDRSPLLHDLFLTSTEIDGIVTIDFPETDVIALEKTFSFLYSNDYNSEYRHVFSSDDAGGCEKCLQHSTKPCISLKPVINGKIHLETTPKEHLRTNNPPLEVSAKRNGTVSSIAINEFRLHCRVYVIADFIGNQDLRETAVSRITNLLQNNKILQYMRSGEFQAIEEVLENTNRDDTLLRLTVLDACTAEIVGGRNTALVKAFAEHEPSLARYLGMWRKSYHAQEQRHGFATASLRAEKRQQEKAVASLQAELDDAMRKSASMHEEIVQLRNDVAKAKEERDQLEKVSVEHRKDRLDSMNQVDSQQKKVDRLEAEAKSLRKDLADTDAALKAANSQSLNDQNELTRPRAQVGAAVVGNAQITNQKENDQLKWKANKQNLVIGDLEAKVAREKEIHSVTIDQLSQVQAEARASAQNHRSTAAQLTQVTNDNAILHEALNAARWDVDRLQQASNRPNQELGHLRRTTVGISVEKIKFIQDLTWTWNHCKGRKCPRSFDSYIEFEGPGGQTPVLRCKRCLAKHRKPL